MLYLLHFLKNTFKYKSQWFSRSSTIYKKRLKNSVIRWHAHARHSPITLFFFISPLVNEFRQIKRRKRQKRVTKRKMLMQYSDHVSFRFCLSWFYSSLSLSLSLSLSHAHAFTRTHTHAHARTHTHTTCTHSIILVIFIFWKKL